MRIYRVSLIGPGGRVRGRLPISVLGALITINFNYRSARGRIGSALPKNIHARRAISAGRRFQVSEKKGEARES